MTTVQPAELVDTRTMVCIHVFLRREFRLAGGVIRAVGEHDVRRARVVADHLQFISDFLHHHHTTEDKLLWPKLLERVPEELAPIVHLMESQHERVDALIQEIGRVLPQWRAQASAADRDQLATLFDELYGGLREHLDAEEQQLLPIVARTISHAEWQELGEAGAKGTPKSKMPLVLGMFQYEGDPDVVDEILSEAPRPVRGIVARMARRAFRKHAIAVNGTPTP